MVVKTEHTRELPFSPCTLTVNGVIINCISEDLAKEFVAMLQAGNEFQIKSVAYCFSIEDVLNSYNTVYEQIKDR
jgi:hypothetical protein